MSSYVIVTDCACDLPVSLIQELELEVLPLYFEIDGTLYPDTPDDPPMDYKTFYQRLRSGAPASTAAANPSDFIKYLEPVLQEGKDALILSFSSGLSSTYGAGVLTASELSEQYPGRKIYTVDTLCASLGQGLLIWYAAKMRQSGASMEAVRDWVEENKLRLCHWFTVDDLMFLKRGGRLSAASALLGTMLSIKPILHVDNDGHLVPVGKARGRSASLRALMEHMKETAVNPGEQTIFISHGDSEEDARRLYKMIQEEIGVKDVLISPICPTIGVHSGPGTIALFFIGSGR
jgi:DegV family protein with EDD domain